MLAILKAMPETWRAFFSLLAHSGVRVGELLGLTWANVHLGDDPHLSIVEQVYRGERKGPKWGSVGKVPLSPGMAAWLSELRSEDVGPDVPLFPSKTGTPLTYANVYNRVLRPALVKAGIAVQVGEVEVRRRDGTVEAVVSGPAEALNDLIALAKEGPRAAQVRGSVPSCHAGWDFV